MANPIYWSIVRGYACSRHIESFIVRFTLQLEKFSYNLRWNRCDHIVELLHVSTLENVNKCHHIKFTLVESEKVNMFKQIALSRDLFSVNFLFYAMNTFGLVSFFVLSLHWPQLMEHWQSIESLPIFQNFVHKTAYTRRIRLISATVLLLAACTCKNTDSFQTENSHFKLLTEIHNFFYSWALLVYWRNNQIKHFVPKGWRHFPGAGKTDGAKFDPTRKSSFKLRRINILLYGWKCNIHVEFCWYIHYGHWYWLDNAFQSLQ